MYEIPQQLEYKEKIAFGLTFGQLIYALAFFPFAFYFFFRINAPLGVRIFLTFIPVTIASGFMFFNLSSHIRNWIGWYRLRKIKSQQEVKNLLGIAEVKDNFLLVK